MNRSKLLAAVAVMAMVFAGAIIILDETPDYDAVSADATVFDSVEEINWDTDGKTATLNSDVIFEGNLDFTGKSITTSNVIALRGANITGGTFTNNDGTVFEVVAGAAESKSSSINGATINATNGYSVTAYGADITLTNVKIKGTVGLQSDNVLKLDKTDVSELALTASSNDPRYTAGENGNIQTKDSTIDKLTLGYPSFETWANDKGWYAGVDFEITDGIFKVGSIGPGLGLGNEKSKVITSEDAVLDCRTVSEEIEKENKNTDEKMGLSDTINVDTIIDGDAYLTETLKIPEGKTLTIKSTGKLDMLDKNLVVEGTLVIEKRGIITTSVGGFENSITIGEKGVIDNSGVIGDVMSVAIKGTTTENASITMKGVTGVNVAVKKISSTPTLVVSGNVSKISGATAPELGLNGVTVNADMKIDKDVKCTADNVKIAKNVTFENKGVMTVTGTLELMNGAKVIVTEGITGCIGTKSGYVGENDQILQTPGGTAIANTNACFDLANVKGVTISVDRFNVVVDDETEIFQGLYIGGVAEAVKDAKGEIKIAATGNVFVADSLIVSKTVAVTGTFDLKDNGTVQFNKDSDDDGFEYIGAKYIIESTVDGASVETVYYTSFDSAIAKIAEAQNSTIYVSGEYTVEGEYTIAADQSIEVDGKAMITVGEDSIVTVKEDGDIANAAVSKIEGKVIVEDGGLFTPAPAAYDVRTEDKEINKVTYSGFALALSEAQPGETIEVVNGATVDGTMSVPAGVTVNVADEKNLKVEGNLNVAEGAKLVLGDEATLTVGTVGKESKITVDGELDASEAGNITGLGTTVNLYSAGTSKIGAAPTNITINAAYYYDDVSVYTSLAKAVAYAMENDIGSVTVIGKFTETGEVNAKGVDIVVGATGVTITNVKLGEIVLDGSKIGSANGGKYTATVSGLNGVGDAATEAGVKVVETAIAIESKVTTNPEGAAVNKLLLDGVNGEVTVSAGTVSFVTTGNVTIAGKFVVASGAELLIDRAVSIDGDSVEFIVDGKVTVKKTTLTFVAKTEGATDFDMPVINGEMILTDDGKVEASALSILGTVDVRKEENKANLLTIKTGNVTVGKALETIGASGSIIGAVTLDANYLVAYAGADLSKAEIDYVSGETDIVSTEYTINETAYATVYANKGNNTEVSTAITYDSLAGIKGLAFPEKALSWMDADDKVADDKKIGEVETVNMKVDPATVTITVSYGTGISLWVDGVKMQNTTQKLTVGEHKVEFTINPGYKGDASITFNGQTVTDGRIVITANMGTSTVLAATGSITVDNGGSSSDDSGMGITDYLLIILVVMVVILAIVVIMRMMRS